MKTNTLDVNYLPDRYRPSVDELPGDVQLVAEAIEESFPGMGVPVVMVLTQRFGGSPLYIRKLNGSLIEWRNDQIRTMYDHGGITGRELAWYWQLSLSSIEKILAQPGKANRKDKGEPI